MPTKKFTKVPRNAFKLAIGHGSEVKFEEGEGENPEETLRMVAYSGGVIKDHWYWGDVVIDLEGGRFNKSTYPILGDHSTSQKIGFTGKPKVFNNSLQIDPDNVKFVDTPESQEFRKLAKQGFPFQASIYGVPSKVESIEEGEEAEVNGFSFKGPGKVWRAWEFKEASVVVFGADENTQSSVFSDDGIAEEIELEIINKFKKEVEEDMPLTLDKLKADHPDLVKSIQDEVEGKFKEDSEKKENKLSELTTIVEKQGKQILSFEKNEELRKLKDLKDECTKIWETKLAASDLPESLFPKVQKHVSFSDFFKDEKFDADAFSEAVGKEIKDWEDMGMKSSILGSGFTKRKVDEKAQEKEKFSEQNDNTVNELLALAGQKVTK